jgi:hypothetical protein
LPDTPALRIPDCGQGFVVDGNAFLEPRADRMSILLPELDRMCGVEPGQLVVAMVAGDRRVERVVRFLFLMGRAAKAPLSCGLAVVCPGDSDALDYGACHDHASA